MAPLLQEFVIQSALCFENHIKTKKKTIDLVYLNAGLRH